MTGPSTPERLGKEAYKGIVDAGTEIHSDAEGLLAQQGVGDPPRLSGTATRIEPPASRDDHSRSTS